MLKYASGLSLITGFLLIFLAVDKTDALRLLEEVDPVWPFLLGIVLIAASSWVLWPRNDESARGDGQSEFTKRGLGRHDY
jgi:hypothetical protein